MPVYRVRKPIVDADIPTAIARDTETAAAVNAHLGVTDPHAQYLLQSEGDARYRITTEEFFLRSPLPAANVAVNSIALSWDSVQIGVGTAEICNYAGSGGGDAFNFFRMVGVDAARPNLFNRVARIDLAGSYFVTSDKRLKSNFSPAPGLAEILALLPQKYRHWECTGFDEKKVPKLGKNSVDKIGFVAQDVQKILSEAVAATNPEEELYGIDYSCIVACAVRAIQELEAQVQELRSQITALSKK